MEENTKRDTSFHIRWGSFIIGFLFGIIGVAVSLFSVNDRRDKIYSSLLGCGVGALITLLLLKFGGLEIPAK